jgi:hypothetical protein
MVFVIAKIRGAKAVREHKNPVDNNETKAEPGNLEVVLGWLCEQHA